MVMMQQVSGGLGMTILIYSQSRPLQQALQSSLYAMGCKAVATAGSAEEAESIFSVQPIEAALVSDAGMVKALQQMSPGLPTLLLTDEDVQSGVGSLKKPFRMRDLEAALLHSVSVSAAQAPAAIAL